LTSGADTRRSGTPESTASAPDLWAVVGVVIGTVGVAAGVGDGVKVGLWLWL
jgi:hypothetical protein